MPDNITDFYKSEIANKGYFKDESEFRTFVSDKKNVNDFFQTEFADKGYFKDVNDFSSFLGVEKKNFVGTPSSGFLQVSASGGANTRQSQSPLPLHPKEQTYDSLLGDAIEVGRNIESNKPFQNIDKTIPIGDRQSFDEINQRKKELDAQSAFAKKKREDAEINTVNRRLKSKGLQPTVANKTSELLNLRKDIENEDVKIVSTDKGYAYGRVPKWHEEVTKSLYNTAQGIGDTFKIYTTDITGNNPEETVRLMKDIAERKKREAYAEFNFTDLVKDVAYPVDAMTGKSEMLKTIASADLTLPQNADPSLGGKTAGYIASMAPDLAVAAATGGASIPTQAALRFGFFQIKGMGETAYDLYNRDIKEAVKNGVPQQQAEIKAVKKIKTNAALAQVPNSLLMTYMFHQPLKVPALNSFADVVGKSVTGAAKMVGLAGAQEATTQAIEASQGYKPEMERIGENMKQFAEMEALFKTIGLLGKAPKYARAYAKEAAIQPEIAPLVAQSLEGNPNAEVIMQEIEDYKAATQPVREVLGNDNMNGSIGGRVELIKKLEDKIAKAEEVKKTLPQSLQKNIDETIKAHQEQIAKANKDIERIQKGEDPLKTELDDIDGKPLVAEEEPLKSTTVMPKSVDEVVGGIEFKNEGNADAPTENSVRDRTSVTHPFLNKVVEGLKKLGILNPNETLASGIVQGISNETGAGFTNRVSSFDGKLVGDTVGEFIFKPNGEISFIDRKTDSIIKVDKNGNIISQEKEAAKVRTKLDVQRDIDAANATIADYEARRDSEAFKQKGGYVQDPLGRKIKTKIAKTAEELKESTDKINKAISDLKNRILEHEKELETAPEAKEEVSIPSKGEVVSDVSEPLKDVDLKGQIEGSAYILKNYKNAKKYPELEVGETLKVPIRDLMPRIGIELGNADAKPYTDAPISVNVLSDGTVQIVDGHNRFKKALLNGDKEVEVNVVKKGGANVYDTWYDRMAVKAVQEGRISAQDAKGIIEKAGLEAPKEIIKLAENETKVTEKPIIKTDEGSPTSNEPKPAESAAAVEQEIGAEEVTPLSKEEFRQHILDNVANVKDNAWTHRITIPGLAQDGIVQAVRNIKEGKNTEAARKLEAAIANMYDRKAVDLNTSAGGASQFLGIPFDEYFSKDRKVSFEDMQQKFSELDDALSLEEKIELDNVISKYENADGTIDFKRMQEDFNDIDAFNADYLTLSTKLQNKIDGIISKGLTEKSKQSNAVNDNGIGKSKEGESSATTDNATEPISSTESIDPKVKQEMGFPLKDWVVKMFTSNRGLPSTWMILKDLAAGNRALAAKNMRKAIYNLQDAVQMTKYSDTKIISEALKDLNGAAYKSLPTEIQIAVKDMRLMVDGYSQKLVNEKLVTPSQALIINEHVGEYLNRSYRFYTDKNWPKKIDKQTLQDAFNFLTQQRLNEINTDKKYQSLTSSEKLELAKKLGEQDANDILTQKVTPKGQRYTEQFSKDLSTLKRREDIPEPIRKLLGEYTDPVTQFSVTISKIATLHSQARLLHSLKDTFKGDLFFGKDDVRPDGFNYQVSADGSQTWNPLAGLYTSKNVIDALQETAQVLPLYQQIYQKAFGTVKKFKTVYSLPTQTVNFFANPLISLSNGHFNLKGLEKSWDYYKDTMFNKNRGSDDILDLLVERNVIGQSVNLRQIREMLGKDKADVFALEEFIKPKRSNWNPLKYVNNIGKVMETQYGASDSFWKVYGFMNEAAGWADALYGKKYNQLSGTEKTKVDDIATERIKNTYPTYDRALPALMAVGKNVPFIGNFMAFQAEVLRTVKNNILYAKEDIKSSDPKIKKLGYKRLAGIISYIGVKQGINVAVSMATGGAVSSLWAAAIGSKDDKDKRQALDKALPSFLQTHNLAVKDKGSGIYSVYDIDRLDPYNVAWQSLNALALGEKGGVERSVQEIVMPFVEVDMVAKAVLDIKNNEDFSGNPIYNVADDTDAQFISKMAYLYRVIEPTTAKLFNRAYASDNATKEIVASLFGARSYTVDAKLSFKSKIRKIEEKVSSNSFFNYKDKEGKKTERTEENLKRAILELSDYYNDMVTIGADPSEMKAILKKSFPMIKGAGDIKKMVLSGVIDDASIESIYKKNKKR